MEQQIGTEQINQVPADIQPFKQIAKIGDFEISPCKKEMNLEDKSSYRKLELTSAQKIQISGLLQHLPQAVTAGTSLYREISRRIAAYAYCSETGRIWLNDSWWQWFLCWECIVLLHVCTGGSYGCIYCDVSGYRTVFSETD